MTVCNVFHAGDGNLHPNIPYNADDPDEAARVHSAMGEIMRACVDAGGSITGEHGVGLDKLGYIELIFSPDSLGAMCSLREVFDPDRRANPGKVVPIHACQEWRADACGCAMTAVASRDIRFRSSCATRSQRELRCASPGRSHWIDAGRPVAATRIASLADACRRRRLRAG